MKCSGFARLFAPAQTLPWQGRAHRFWYRLCAVCLTLYLAYVLYLSRSALFATPADTVAALFCFAAAAAGLWWALNRLASLPGVRTAPAHRAKLAPGAFAVGAGISFGVLAAYLLAADPGGVTVDSAVQWTQAGTGVFVNWHPAFHTFLLRLLWLLKPDYTFALLAQCLLASLAIGYLVATLRAWGVNLLLLAAVTGLMVAAPIVGHCMMYLWKDNFMTVGAVILTAQAVNLYLSRGAWLSSAGNAIGFGLALAATTLVRHNALLFTLPLLLAALCTARGRLTGALVTLLTTLFALWLALGPLYGALHVTYPKNTLEESIGVPMTVISNLRAQNPAALDAETRAFTDAMGDDAAWSRYLLNQYNSIKFGRTRGVIAHSTLAQVLRMAANAAKADPRGAFATVNAVTGLVWEVSGDRANVMVRNSGNLPSVPKNSGRLNALGSALSSLVAAPLALAPVAWYAGNLGVSLALMLVFALRALRRNGTLALMLCLPTLLYCMGTMCVLCGEDERFFSFSPLVCTFSLLAMALDRAPDAGAPESVAEKVVTE